MPWVEFLDYTMMYKQLSQQEKDWHVHSQFGHSKEKISQQANSQQTGIQQCVILIDKQNCHLLSGYLLYLSWSSFCSHWANSSQIEVWWKEITSTVTCPMQSPSSWSESCVLNRQTVTSVCTEIRLSCYHWLCKVRWCET